jgi:hypothetical protein
MDDIRGLTFVRCCGKHHHDGDGFFHLVAHVYLFFWTSILEILGLKHPYVCWTGTDCQLEFMEERVTMVCLFQCLRKELGEGKQ